MTRARCDWIKDVGYDRGRQCGNDGKYSLGRRCYCGAHFAMASNPKRAATQKRIKAAIAALYGEPHRPAWDDSEFRPTWDDVEAAVRKAKKT